MGACGCANKSVQSQDNVVNPARKRLSVSKCDPVSEKKVEKEKEVVKTTEEGSMLDLILELFPESHRKLSIRGTSSESQQKGFADKKIEKSSYSDDKVSRIGYACKKGLKPESPNQDDFCIYCTDMLSIFGVFDGHGNFGHDIADFTHKTLTETLARDLRRFFVEPKQALEDAFRTTHTKCVDGERKHNFDCSLSGTTATLTLFDHKEQRLHVAHVGDSRAVLAKGSRNSSELRCDVLTVDHKPDIEAERLRIVQKGGQVKQLQDDIPQRVFLKDQMYPGLAMTRSIGDTVGVEVGVISKPDVCVRDMPKGGKPDEEWRFLLVCSDGVWEFISEQDAVNMVASYPPPDCQKGVDALASEAWNRWIKEEINVVDDITIIVYWFPDK
jgi:serine/threonine protein phosphatase PrpC